jgi:cytoskeleton protein RodZ
VFVRGFLRNYAKLLQLDADALLAQLPSPAPAATPAAAAALALEAQATEGRRASRSAPGWLAGAAVLAALLVAAIYEGRQHQSATPLPGPEQPSTGGLASPQHADSPPPGLAPTNPQFELAQSATGTVPGAETGAVPGAPTARPAVSEAVLAVPAAGPDADPGSVPAQAARSVAPPAVVPPAAPAVASVQTPATAPSAPAGGVAASAQLRLAFEAEAWVEVKDASGAVIFSRLNSAGSEQVVQGVPPLQLLVGNAHGVKVSYRGRPVDLGPHTRVDVARLVLE